MNTELCGSGPWIKLVGASAESAAPFTSAAERSTSFQVVFRQLLSFEHIRSNRPQVKSGPTGIESLRKISSSNQSKRISAGERSRGRAVETTLLKMEAIPSCRFHVNLRQSSTSLGVGSRLNVV